MSGESDIDERRRAGPAAAHVGHWRARSLFVAGLLAVAVVSFILGRSSVTPRAGAPPAGGEVSPAAAGALGVSTRSPLAVSGSSPLSLPAGVQQALLRRWPLVLRQGGAYAVPTDETAQFEQTGLTLALTNHIPARGDGRTRYVDPRITNLEARFFGHYHCSQSTAPCPISAADEAAFLTAVRAEIARQEHNPSVVGYYILDDYFGNYASVLTRVHALIAAANRGLSHPRPAICGFGGSLDFLSRRRPEHFIHDYAALGHFTRKELLNFSPANCDMVDFYIYAVAKHSPVSNYAMSWTMPTMLAELRLRGWNPDTTPLLGSPQAWEGIPDTAAQLRRQTTAFCAYGAQGIIAFTWHNFPSSGAQATPELANRPELRGGLAAGMRACRRIWSTNTGSVSLGAGTVRVPPRLRPVPLSGSAAGSQ